MVSLVLSVAERLAVATRSADPREAPVRVFTGVAPFPTDLRARSTYAFDHTRPSGLGAESVWFGD
jgi:hypothetical protein